MKGSRTCRACFRLSKRLFSSPPKKSDSVRRDSFSVLSACQHINSVHVQDERRAADYPLPLSPFYLSGYMFVLLCMNIFYRIFVAFFSNVFCNCIRQPHDRKQSNLSVAIGTDHYAFRKTCGRFYKSGAQRFCFCFFCNTKSISGLNSLTGTPPFIIPLKYSG